MAAQWGGRGQGRVEEAGWHLRIMTAAAASVA